MGSNEKILVFTFSSQGKDYQSVIKELRQNHISVSTENYTFKDYRGITRRQVKVYISQKDEEKFKALFENNNDVFQKSFLSLSIV